MQKFKSEIFARRKFKKRLLFFLVGFVVMSHSNLSAQKSSIQTQKVTLAAEKMSLRDIFKAIEKQSNFFFHSVDADIEGVTVSPPSNGTIHDVLDSVLKNAPLTYSVNGRHISISKKEKPAATQSKTADKNRSVTGVVSDENGEPLPGASIVVKGSTRGVTTDADGTFKIEVSADDILEFSFIGYEMLPVKVGTQTYISIKLEPKRNELDEVTVVAFGKQKKESVIGSVTTIAPKNLKVPSSNLTTAFAGQMAGVIAYQRSGEPGADDADFYVRGITTFGVNRNPLILIDNIELTKTDLARLQPDDIASFSVMKDATATALYGARGANGVILITTKQGEEGPPKVSLRIEQSMSSPTRKVELVDPITWMQLANESVLTRNPMGFAPYTDEKIDNTINGTDPYLYPAVDWMDMLIRDNSTSSRYNIQLSGGGKAHRYYVAGALNHDNGIMKVDKRNNFNSNINNNSYSLRSNIELQVTPTTLMNVRLSGVFDDYSGPLTSGTDLFRNIIKSNSVLFPAYYPASGSYSEVRHIMFGNKDNQYYNPYAESVKGYKERNRSQMLAQVEAKQDLNFITEGLSVQAMMNISRLSQFSVSRYYTPYWYELKGINPITGEYMINNTNTGTDWLDYSEGDKETNSTLYVEAMANYNRTFGDHSVNGLLVTILRESLYANTGSLQLSLPHRNLGVSGRFTYGFSNRYFLEFNFGYNGSERFSANHRWGFFPSVGAAWNIANEKFW
ncbi:MAG: SusC/RagA family TonB-linked outer membrane protein, partial [Dysgonamonadaceae bacterium]|nr:SusC/RagA family TonB-linked outer membrane protein [Dysgonamonadaceae bacterium]